MIDIVSRGGAEGAEFGMAVVVGLAWVVRVCAAGSADLGMSYKAPVTCYVSGGMSYGASVTSFGGRVT